MMVFPERYVPSSRSHNAINPQEVKRENREPLGNVTLKQRGKTTATKSRQEQRRDDKDRRDAQTADPPVCT